MTDKDVARFWAKVQKSDACWVWTGTITANGYGVVHISGRQWYTHLVSYQIARGDIPFGLTLDHLCRNRRCVNPSHLEAVTGVENVMRGSGFAPTRAAAIRCEHGHEWTPENTIIRRDGRRRCRECNKRHQREYKSRCGLSSLLASDQP